MWASKTSLAIIANFVIKSDLFTTVQQFIKKKILILTCHLHVFLQSLSLIDWLFGYSVKNIYKRRQQLDKDIAAAYSETCQTSKMDHLQKNLRERFFRFLIGFWLYFFIAQVLNKFPASLVNIFDTPFMKLKFWIGLDTKKLFAAALLTFGNRYSFLTCISKLSEALRFSVKKVFLKISQNSPENTCARVSF